MTKKVIQTVLLIALFATPIVTTTTVFAEDFDTKIQEQDKKINELKNESQNTKTDLEKITTNVTQNEEKSKQILVDMQATQNKMDTLQQENQELTIKIDQREDQLEKQARVVQVNGDTQNYIDFVLEAKSMSDIIGRVDVVAQMVSANRAMVKQQADDKAQVVKQEKEVAKKSDEQKVLAADLAKTQEKLQTQKLEKESIVAQIAADTATAEGDKNKFLAQKAAAEKEAEDLRIAKVAADKKASADAEAERVVQLANAKAAEAAKNTTVAATPATPPAENPQGGGTPPVSTGAYGRPTNAPVSSSYGPRSGYDANGFHKGIDFGGAVGTPIYASMSGRVVIAQYDGMPVSGYGIATVIQHDNGTWTLYAHQSSQSVKVGDVVTKGQQIGAIGATGQVDGAHLHFEIRTAQDGGMGNVVDPAPLLGL